MPQDGHFITKDLFRSFLFDVLPDMIPGEGAAPALSHAAPQPLQPGGSISPEWGCGLISRPTHLQVACRRPTVHSL